MHTPRLDAAHAATTNSPDMIGEPLADVGSLPLAKRDISDWPVGHIVVRAVFDALLSNRLEKRNGEDARDSAHRALRKTTEVLRSYAKDDASIVKLI